MTSPLSATPMGSISRLHAPSQNPLASYRVYTSFCSKNLFTTSSMSNWIECYSPSTNSWRHVTRIPALHDNHVLKAFSMVAIGDFIYVIGGKLCRKALGTEQGKIVETEVAVLPSVQRYHLRSGAWCHCTAMSVPRFDFACTVYNGRIYVAGGQCSLESVRGTSSAEVFDPASDRWTQLPNMSTLRYKCVGVTWQAKIHVVGGFAERADMDRLPWNTKERCSAEVYDWENDKWDLVLGMWQLDVPPNQIVAVGRKLYSSGDCLNAWKGHIEVYDGKIWTEVDGSHLEQLSSPVSTSEVIWPPLQRLYLTMAPIGSHLYFLVGYRKPGEIARVESSVHVFDTAAQRDGWRSFESTEEQGEKELCCHGCVVRLGQAE